ncbi:MAG: ABC transporter ATP-binding protein [Candidatus Abyssobacteria bacterium SURF_5]|uniref:ABC transporter ATP-binding protein n=1 Tax=Abyssobacteria bacterium (strain SURF_5) TaxID=2093360 RepID=A0A3A4NTW5_ABYX5|nr:MAG: ABC transporter ATP-binding protein [Candidatus Abyssubacteria bacterium SURF_5]
MIEIRNLSRYFGSLKAVDNLNLTVGEGEFFCFLGPNGAGKTTTIKILTGLLRPTSGTAIIAGYDITTDMVKAKRILGYIPDHPYVYEKLSGREFMKFVSGMYNLDSAATTGKIEELMRLFGIAEYADQLIEDYSHGMRQKLIFSATFLHSPKIVIVDEPWVGLDPKSIRFVKDYLKEKTRDGVSIFMSTHTLSIAEEVADRVGIIHKGRLIAHGTVAKVKASTERNLEDVFLQLTAEDPEIVAPPEAKS